MQRARLNAEIIDEATTAAEQRSIFDALNRTSDPRLVAAFTPIA
jgi:hypothetical protein